MCLHGFRFCTNFNLYFALSYAQYKNNNFFITLELNFKLKKSKHKQNRKKKFNKLKNNLLDFVIDLVSLWDNLVTIYKNFVKTGMSLNPDLEDGLSAESRFFYPVDLIQYNFVNLKFVHYHLKTKKHRNSRRQIWKNFMFDLTVVRFVYYHSSCNKFYTHKYSNKWWKVLTNTHTL